VGGSAGSLRHRMRDSMGGSGGQAGCHQTGGLGETGLLCVREGGKRLNG